MGKPCAECKNPENGASVWDKNNPGNKEFLDWFHRRKSVSVCTVHTVRIFFKYFLFFILFFNIPYYYFLFVKDEGYC